MNKLYFLAFLLLCTQLFHAQDNVSKLGGHSIESVNSGSYSINQVFNTANTLSAGSFLQGVQPSLEIQTLSNLELLTLQSKKVAYSNPTKAYVVLKITDTALENLRYTFFDFNDESIASKTITISNILINM
jgi:hypothetical protein|tara:strand:- start:325 stop:717 length:393 start_codon:yes stop_codon:yes gene_type:complete